MTGEQLYIRVGDIRNLLSTATVSYCRGQLLQLEGELEKLGTQAVATRPRDRNKTVQDVGTPPEFIAALEAEFGPLGWDLAATPELAKCPRYITPGVDSLTVPWHQLHLVNAGDPRIGAHPQYDALLAMELEAELMDPSPVPMAERFHYLNPPFSKSDVWVRKCAEEARLGARLLVLLQASVDTDYYQDSIIGCCECRQLRGRLKFQGHTKPFPKPCMLCVYEPDRRPCVLSWDWKRGVLR